METNQPTTEDQGGMDPNLAKQLRTLFTKMVNDIEIVLFTDPNNNDPYCDAARQAIRMFRQLTDRIEVREYDLNHEKASEWEITESPTIVIQPETYHLRWIGAPVGEEGRIFLETILLVGMGESNLSEPSKKVMAKVDDPRRVKIFVSPTCPYCPQEAINGVKAAIERPDTVNLEIIDIQCKPQIAEQYGVQGVPQAFANDVNIGQGAQSEEVFCASLASLEPQTIFIPDVEAAEIETDVVIVGGGPAGLTAAIYLERSGLKTALVEREALGGQVATTPVVENYTGFTSVGGKTLVDIMVTHAMEYAQIFKGEEVLEITGGEPFTVKTSRRTFKAKRVLLSTGATHRHLGVPGEERLSGKGVTYCATCDGPLFKGRKVIMVGGGNSAVTEALYLKNMGVDVSLVHRRDKLRAQSHLVKQLTDNGIPVIWNTEVKEIIGNDRVTQVILKNGQTGETTTKAIDGVFIAIGYKPATKLARLAGVDLTDDGYIAKQEKHRTNIPGIYAAGDVEGGYKQIVTAVGQGAEAAMSIFEDIINPYWQREETVKLKAV